MEQGVIPMRKHLPFATIFFLAYACSQVQPTGAPQPQTATSVVSPTSTQPVPSTIHAPHGNAATVDGTFSPGEWDGALTTDLTNGGKMMLMHDEGYLYLGIRSVSILHSSAGLGTAIYEKDDQGWHRIRQFSYCCWGVNQSKLREYLQTEAWVSSVGTRGVPEEMEYQIAMNDGSLILAVVYVDDLTFETALYWPENLTDDCLGLALIPEDPPERLLFSPETWVTIIGSTE
jgi:hypothetical protein